jgi:cystathionine beta-lyase/cystathionine gamma-synthase
LIHSHAHYFFSLLYVISNAHAIALFLESHAAVAKVVYPGLPSHPQHALAQRQQHGFGSMIAFSARGGRAQASAILQKVKHAPSDTYCTRGTNVARDSVNY